MHKRSKLKEIEVQSVINHIMYLKTFGKSTDEAIAYIVNTQYGNGTLGKGIQDTFNSLTETEKEGIKELI